MTIEKGMVFLDEDMSGNIHLREVVDFEFYDSPYIDFIDHKEVGTDGNFIIQINNIPTIDFRKKVEAAYKILEQAKLYIINKPGFFDLQYQSAKKLLS